MAPGLSREESVARFRWKGLGLVGPVFVLGCGMWVNKRWARQGSQTHRFDGTPPFPHTRTKKNDRQAGGRGARTRKHADVLERHRALEEAEAAEDRDPQLHFLLHLQGVGQREEELPLCVCVLCVGWVGVVYILGGEGMMSRSRRRPNNAWPAHALAK